MIRDVTSFPTVYGAIETDTLLHAFAEATPRIRAALAGLSAEELAIRARGPDRWSAAEIVLHLADSELMGAARVRMLVAQPGATLPIYDQDEFAAALAYHEAEGAAIERALRLFDLLRQTTLRIFRRVAPDDWDTTGLHPEWGSVTLRQLLELYADHGERHVEQILDGRARMGRPLDMTALLPERLY